MPELTGPMPNRFRAFSTMTYSISLYLQSPDQYAEMQNTGKKDVTGLELLIQSAGITNTGDPFFGAKRNKFFTRDFYLDDIQLQSYIAGTATGGPQNTFEVKFTVTEPMGLTFMERLYNASTEHAANLGFKNFNPVNQLYLMVIRFYGYDEKGKQVINGKFDNSSDTNSYVEKWIPIMIRSIQFSVESSKVVYRCECVAPQTQIGHGQIHGTIPFNMALQGSTLEELLNGPATPTPGGVINTGLKEALNNHQATLTKKVNDTDKKYEIPDVYEIELADELKNAVTFAPGTNVIQRSASPGTATGAALSKLSSNNAKVASTSQTFATNAGMKIVKFIDLAIRSSSYISDQYKKLNDANKDGIIAFKKVSPGPLNWFKIRPSVEILGFDSIRQSWAYKITYHVSVYPVITVNTEDFDSADCFKVHKEYDFWFTGKNTEVLNFKQDFNSFYYTTFSDKHKQDPTEYPRQQTNLRAMNVYRTNSTESDLGGDNGTAEQAANAASILYAPQDIANCEIDILGDPDWLAQSELFFKATKNRGEAVLNDGSINYDRAEVFFSVNFNTVVDYDLRTGLADVTQKNVTLSADGSVPNTVSQYAFVYRANTITTQFEKGKFTQQLKGTLVYVPEVCIKSAPAVADGGAGDGTGVENGGPAAGNGTLAEPRMLPGTTIIGDPNGPV
jgi:hypothetical protein